MKKLTLLLPFLLFLSLPSQADTLKAAYAPIMNGMAVKFSGPSAQSLFVFLKERGLSTLNGQKLEENVAANSSMICWKSKEGAIEYSCSFIAQAEQNMPFIIDGDL